MLPESHILSLLKAGDERCMRMIFDRYYRALCVYAMKYLTSVDDAEDVVQNVFVSFWENKKGNVFEGSLRSYLFGAVAKASVKFLHRSGQFTFDDIELHVNRFLEEMDCYEEEEQDLLKRKLEQEIEKLPEKSKAVFNAIVIENLSYKQVSERYHISVNTVKTQYAHALKKLRENLGDLFIWMLLFM